MKATNLTTRTYNTPTCLLEIHSKASPLPHLARLHQPKPVDFTLHLNYPEGGATDSDRIQGTPQQLTDLHRAVSQYVQNLISEFPLPAPAQVGAKGANGQLPTTPTQSENPSPTNLGNETHRTLRAGVPNLPGLRQSPQQSTDRDRKPESGAAPTQLSLRNISKLLNHWHENSEETAPVDRPQTGVDLPATNAIESETSATPYLTKNPEDLSHSLHLGDLATTPDRGVLTLSALQLFDLASALDSATAEMGIHTGSEDADKPDLPGKLQAVPTNDSHFSVAKANAPDPESTLAARLPNLPKLSTGNTTSADAAEPDPAYGSNRPALLAAAPWAVAAAVAVGAPLLILGPNSSSLKEIAGKVKLPEVKVPNLNGSQQSIASKLPQPETSSPTNPNPSPGASTDPWQVRPVQPPAGVDAQTKNNNGRDGIELAPLPSTLMGQAADPRNPVTQDSLAKAAPIPANPRQITAPGGGLPTGINSPTTTATKMASVKPAGMPTDNYTNPIVTLPTNLTKPAKTKLPQVRVKSRPIAPDKVAISQREVAVAPDLAKMPTVKLPSQSIVEATPPQFPRLAQPIAPKTTATKKPAPAKLAKASVPKSPQAKSTTVAIKPQPALVPVEPEMSIPQAQQPPSSPELTQPNTIPTVNPDPKIGMGEKESGGEKQTPPAMGEPTEPSKISKLPTTDPFNSPAIQATKRYLQGKWKADPKEFNPLQYVIEISGNNGTIKSVTPQGEAAQSYLQKTGIIKAGERLLSPNTAGNPDWKIRTILQPDGNVDAFAEP